MSEQNPINFFEIPATDLERAKTFYEAVLKITMETVALGDTKLAFIPRGPAVGGAVVQGEGYVPSQQGTLVYLNGTGDFEGILERVAQHGGRVVVPKTSIGEHGHIARFIDCEGNRVALHTM